jgi:GlpG protein
MLMITSFANPRVAQAFVDYMATQGIILTIQQHTQSDIWLADESQAGRVRPSWPAFWKTRRSALSGGQLAVRTDQ